MRVQKTPRTLPIDAIFAFNGYQITDHNRRPVTETPTKIQNENRMVNGTLRRYVVKEKRNWKVSWEDTPNLAEWVFDGFWSGQEILDFYNATPGEFVLTITQGTGETEEVLVMFDSWNKTVVRRTTDYEFWNFDFGLVEV
jgi:hypothetical protein